MDQSIIRTADRKKNYRLDIQGHRTVKEKWQRYFRHHDISPARRSVIDFWYDSPVEEKTVLLCGLGRNINGNLKYILDVLNHDDRFEGYRVYVRTTFEQTDEYVNKCISEYGWTRTSTVPKKYDMMMETCQYLLTESWFPYQYTKRPDQTLINTWHGTPLKKIGALRSGDKCHSNSLVQKNLLSADYLLYPNELTRDLLWKSFPPACLLKAKALMMGYPRTAGILKVTEEEQKELRESLGPEGCRIYAYMPTFRDYLSDEEFIDRTVPVLKYLDENLTDGQMLYVNLHHYHHRNNFLDLSGYKHVRKFPQGIDTYKMLSVTDVLISDYSSIFFDFLITGRQVILYVEDLDEYLEHQGLNLDIKSLPLDLAFSKEELLSEMNSGPQREDSKEIRDLYKYDYADNPEKLCGLFLNNKDGLELDDIPGPSEPAVLLYSDGFRSEPEAKLLKELALSTDRRGYEVFVGCDEEAVEADKQNAYPELHSMQVISSSSRQPLSSVGAPVLELYKAGKISFRKAMTCLAPEYALMYTRIYGMARIDMICVMDSCDPETILGMALSPARRRLLFVSREAVNELKRGNRFLRDAVRYAADYYDLIITLGGTDQKYVRSLLPLLRKSKLIAVDGAEEIDSVIRQLLN